MKRILICSILVLLLIPVGYNLASARTWDVTIPTGAADPTNAEKRFFYSPWELTIELYDTVSWGNGDTASHTVTSGNPTDGPDGLFDSSLFGAGKLFSHKFVKGGTYPYYCAIHPWMIGKITVVGGESMKVLRNVGADAGDGKTTFDIEYLLEKTLLSAEIDESQKAVTFTMAGKGNDGDLFVLKLPKDLISGDLIVWVDNQPITEFEIKEDGGINRLTIPLTSKSETVTILGSNIVPEFGPIAVLILVIAITGIIVVNAKSHNLFLVRL
ncbi:MAG: PEFG-CTERM sorting domain-containing protein [Nitrosopumilaceae archaeon]